ncbi:MAG: PAS domain S-box protein, partial [Planctomycetota bacterium]
GVFFAPDSSKEGVRLTEDRLLDFVADDSGAVWVSTAAEIAEFRSGVRTGRGWDTSGADVTSLRIVGDRLIGIMGRRLVAMDLESGASETLIDDQGVMPRRFHVDQDGTIWMTTYGRGLLRRQSDGSITRWSTEDGLPCSYLGWIGRVPGPTEASHLWVGSNHGTFAIATDELDRYATGQAESIEFKWFHTPESDGASGAILPGGKLVLPTLFGEALIDTGGQFVSEPPPVVNLTDVTSKGRPVDLADGVTGPIDLEFSFRTVQFPSSARAHVEFTLDGYDAVWLAAGSSRTIRYTNISPGSYRFKVRARAVGGAFGDVVEGEEVVVKPQWWRSTIGRAGILGVLAALIAAGVRARTRALLMRSRILEEEVAKRRSIERDLVASRLEFFSVLEAAEEGIFSFDESGRVHFANAAMSRIFGIPSHGFMDLDVEDLGIEELIEDESLRQLQATALESERMRTLETRATRADGTRFACELTLSLQQNAQPIRLVGLLRDVSEREEAARQVEGLRRQLAKAEESQRSHIARELHDDYSQRLMATALHLETVQRELKSEAAAVDDP